MHHAQRFAVAILLAACSQTIAADVVAGGGAHLPAPTRELLATYPGSRVQLDEGRVRMIYGVPMTAGVTPREAAEGWLEAHNGAFGVGQLALEELWATPVMQGRFTVFGYRQHIDGLPVEYGNVRVLVLNEPIPRVVYAAATVAPRPQPGQARLNLDGDTARQLVQAAPLFRNLPEWSDPELAIYQGDGQWTAPRTVWKFIGEGPDQAKTFFVDAATGELVHIRSEIYHNEITGTVKGWATPGTLPDAVYNPPTLQNIPEMRVRIDGGPSAFTTLSGSYSIGNAGTGPLNIGTGVGVPQGYGGRWVNVVPVSAAPVLQLVPTTPPGQVNFVLNATPSQQLTAQVNVFIGTILVHNYFKDRAPSFTALDTALRANTGVTDVGGSCNAYFRASDPSINFHNAGGSCPNTGYSSVIAHEYGHFIVNRLNLGQGGFGEGYSDTTAMLLYDDGVVGRGFFGPGSILRDPIASNVQYPCPTSGTGSGIHHCGMMLAGTWWRMRQNFGAHLGSAQGLDHVRELQVAWSLATYGGTGSSFRNAAHPDTAIEVLIIDDDDGNLANGTPNWSRICSAFAAHGIDCPPLTLVEFAFPEGIPERTPPNLPLDFAVHVQPVASEGIPGTGELFYRLPGSATFTSAPMTETAPNQYIATLPGTGCGEFVEFYVRAEALGGYPVTYPADAPAEFLTARGLAGTAETIVFDDDFETDKGWTVWNDPSLTEGHWERVVPIGSFYNSQPVQPGNAVRGQRCFVTENGAPGAPVNAHDVDWGPTVLTSPRIDITGADIADLNFAYWHYTLNGMPDFLEVDISPDDGLNWIRIATYGNSGGWQSVRVDLLEWIDPTPELRVRFSVADVPNDSLTESAVDDVRVTIWQCTISCYANCDGSTVEPILTVDDFTCFINKFAQAQSLPHEEQLTHYANCDGSTIAPVLSVDDFTCFINAFAQGCP